MRLLVHTGSLHESDDQRGVAHLVQHMAFHGSENFPGDSARKMFESLGMELEGDVHVTNGFRAAWFTDPDGNILHLNNM